MAEGCQRDGECGLMTLRNTDLLSIEEAAREFEAAWSKFLLEVEEAKAKALEEGSRRPPEWYAQIYTEYPRAGRPYFHKLR